MCVCVCVCCSRKTQSVVFRHDLKGKFEEFITKFFGFDRVLPTTTGSEACEVAIKIARAWGYRVKGIPEGQATLVYPFGNYHGRSFAALSASNVDHFKDGFGPFMNGFKHVDFDGRKRKKKKKPKV